MEAKGLDRKTRGTNFLLFNALWNGQSDALIVALGLFRQQERIRRR